MSEYRPDQERLECEWQADQDVLRSLRENGDDSSLVRPVDVAFRGSKDALTEIATGIAIFGLRPIQLVELETSECRLDTEIDQTTDEEAIRSLTTKALEIEDKFGVIYDGWGCVATRRKAF